MSVDNFQLETYRAEAAALRGSFFATIAYGLLVLAGLIVASLLGWVLTGSSDCHLALLLALAATGAAYLSQLFHTTHPAPARELGMATLLQLVSVLLCIASFAFLAWAS